MINNSKITENTAYLKNNLIHRIPAGTLPTDNNIEMFANRDTRTVFFTKNGKTLPFSALPHSIHLLIMERLQKDPIASAELNARFGHIMTILEEYAFCVYGALDSSPDFTDKQLSESENFLCEKGSKCTCLNWKSKWITVDGYRLTKKQINFIYLLATGKPDKQIADQLIVSLSTLNTNKHRLFEVFKVYSKAELLLKAAHLKILQ